MSEPPRPPARPMGRVNAPRASSAPSGPVTEDVAVVSPEDAEQPAAAEDVAAPEAPPVADDEPPARPASDPATADEHAPPAAGGGRSDERTSGRGMPPTSGARPTRSWWRRGDPRALDMAPVSHLTHHLAYELTQAVVVAGLLAALAYVALGGRFADLYVRLHGTAPTSGEVALLTVGEEAFYLWDPADPEPDVIPRALLAELVRFLDAADARVVVLDILLDRSAADDVLLAEAAATHGAVIGAERFAVTEPAAGREFAAGVVPTLAGVIPGGLANLQEEEPALFSDGDLLVRRAPLVRRIARAQLQGSYPASLAGGEQTDAEVRPSLALLAAWLHRARGADPDAAADGLARALADGCAAGSAGAALRCEQGLETALGLPSLPSPLHEPLTINFRGPEHGDGLPVVRASQALRLMGESALLASLGVEMPVVVPAEIADVLRDRTVVVCRVDAAAEDRFVTPYSFPMLLDADMAGGRIQAQLIDTLLSGRHARPLGAWAPWLLAVLLVVGIVATTRVLRDDTHSLLWLGVGGALVVFGALLFRWTDGVVLELGLPLAAMLVALTGTRLHGWMLEDPG